MSLEVEPSRLYGDGARTLQDAFDSRRLADRLAGLTLHDALSEDDMNLVRAQSTVWLATVDADGWPDVSYKGGDVGFVTVRSATQLRIPNYDGNGMFRSLGNVRDTGRVALLFVDTTRPWRMRVHGRGSVNDSPADLAHYPGARVLLDIEVLRVFPNCGRYIHGDDGISVHVPRAGTTPPMASWKRFDAIRDALPAADLERLANEDNNG